MYGEAQNPGQLEYLEAAGFTVYADFSCPFSYALHERLCAMNLEHQVDFRMIRQMPGQRAQAVSFELLGEITTAVAEVRRRAPSTEINVPMFRPDSAAATALVYVVGLNDPLEAARLRRRVYRALWVEGRDIADATTLASLLLELDIELPRWGHLSNLELSAWQAEWSNNTEFERNLPVIIGAGGETVIGIPLEPELNAFLETGSMVTDAPGDLLESQQRQRILVLDNHAPSLRIVIEQMHDAQVEVFEDIIGLIARVSNFGMPDLLMVNTDLIGNIKSRDWWRNLTNSDPDPAIPIVHVLDQPTAVAEDAAVEAGAADIIARPFCPKQLRLRLNSQLRSRRARQQISKVARVDALTAACNRREFDYRLRTEWGRGARAGNSLALLMVDVDRLRAYNDTYGHLRGDDCLVKLVRLLGRCLPRDTDWVARYSGGLFAVVLPRSDTASALDVARDCRQAIADAGLPHLASPIAAQVTVSIGVAAMTPIADTGCTLLVEQAEVALYQARRMGGNRVCAFGDEIRPNRPGLAVTGIP